MLDLRAFRFDGLHLEPTLGTFVSPTGPLRRIDLRTISFGPPSDLATPIGAILHLDVLLAKGEWIAVMGLESPEYGGFRSFRHTYVIAPGATVRVKIHRSAGIIETHLRCENGELTIARQDKPAGC